MNRWFKFSGVSATALLLSTTASFADVSSQDVWSAWKGVLTGVGYTVEGHESQTGGTLTVSDLVMSFDMEPEDGIVTMSVGEMTFEEQGDGTVRIGMPASFPIKVTEDGNDSDMVVLTLSMDGSDIVASGDPDNVTYTYSIDSATAALTDLIVEGEKADFVEFDMVMSTLAGESNVSDQGMFGFSQNMSVSSVMMKAKVDEPEGDRFEMSADILGMKAQGSGTMPKDMDPEDPGAMLRAGFDVNGSLSADRSTVVVEGTDANGPFKFDFGSGGSNLAVKMGEGVFDYDGGVMDLAVSMVGGDIPLPIVLNIDEFSYGILMPLLKSTSEQDFDFNFTLAGLTISDMLWGMFDPGGQLPHDPATVKLNLNGKTTLFEDIVSEDIDDADEFPGELNSVSLNELLVDMLGARVSGDGGFVFDNTDKETFDGMPRPEGSVAVNVKGANALMDTLVAMGLLPEEQVMTARMMMAMFSVPGESEDEMNSVLEINAEGHVLANGQRLQ